MIAIRCQPNHRLTVRLTPAVCLASAGFLLLATSALAQSVQSPLERYRRLEFPPIVENFDKGWQERVVLEYEIVNAADLKSLRAALRDDNAFVRAVAARTLGILEDKESAGALAGLLQNDPDPMVRIRAVESLGFLKMHAEVIEAAMKDRDAGVCWSAQLASRQIKSEVNYAAQVREAFRGGIAREKLG